MSEYQYFEFQAVDKPLDEKAMRELRKITSRAEITPRHLVNEYEWGDFKGNPLHLMEDYFDAHLHYTNWGTRRLMLRLPKGSFEPDDFKPYRVDRCLELHTTEDHLIFEFETTREEADLDEYEGFLDDLIPLRHDLASGDLRFLYLGWLASLLDQNWGDEPDSPEPPVPPGLKKLSKQLKTFSEFFGVDARLLKIAQESPSALPTEKTDADPLAWLACVPVAEKDAYLARLLSGDGAKVQAELTHRFHKETAPPSKKGKKLPPGRTAGQIMDQYETE